MNIFFEQLHVGVVLLFWVAWASGCGKQDESSSANGGEVIPVNRVELPAPTGSGDSTASILSTFSFDPKDMVAVKLPKGLYEISGLAIAPDGGLYGHNDEHGIVYRINPETGDVAKRFALGKIAVKDDFEGIAIVGERFFLVNSSGDLFEFREGKDREHVEFTRIKTWLSGKYDVEGLCYDPVDNALLLVCKEYPGESYNKKDEKTIYAFSLASMELRQTPRLVIPAKHIRKELDLKNFKPSGIDRHPVTGSFLLISSNDPAIVEVSPNGHILALQKLPDSILKQPEGIAFNNNGDLFISSEGGRLASVKRVESRR